MYSWPFSRVDGAGSATRRNTRGLTRSVIARIVPPFPAASRPSKTTITRRPLYLTQSWSLQSSLWSRLSSFSYCLRFKRTWPFPGSLCPINKRSLNFKAGYRWTRNPLAARARLVRDDFMETRCRALQTLIGPNRLEECRIKKNLAITGPSASGLRPEAPFCLPASGGENYAPLAQRICNLFCGVKPRSIDERNREHIE